LLKTSSLSDDTRQLIEKALVNFFEEGEMTMPLVKRELSGAFGGRPRQRSLREVRVVPHEVIFDVLEVRCGGRRPADAHHDRNIGLMRAFHRVHSSAEPGL
jgi:hypothetical protein